MTEVLQALKQLDVWWKKIGHYNIKARWLPIIAGNHEGMVNNGYYYPGDESTSIKNGVTKLPNVVKFEVQVRPLWYSWIKHALNKKVLIHFAAILDIYSFTKLVKIRGICWIFRGFRGHSFCSWSFALHFLHSFGSSNWRTLYFEGPLFLNLPWFMYIKVFDEHN